MAKPKRVEQVDMFRLYLNILEKSINAVDGGFVPPSSVESLLRFVKNNLVFTNSHNEKDWKGVKIKNSGDKFAIGTITDLLADVMNSVMIAAVYLNDLRVASGMPTVNIAQKAVEIEQGKKRHG